MKSDHKCSVCGQQSDTELDARIIHASGIHPAAKYCPHCGQYPPSVKDKPITVTLLEQPLEQEPFTIGIVTAPVGITADNVDAELDRLWREWREADPEPDSDSEFVLFLTECGWKEIESYAAHTFYT